MSRIFDFLLGHETKSSTTEQVTRRSEQYIEDRISAQDSNGFVSVVHACGVVIAQGLSLPPIYVQVMGNGGRTYDLTHNVHKLLTQAPNKTQIGYELRETMGWQAAISGNAYAWLNRSKTRAKEILEIVPLSPHEISRVDSNVIGEAPTFTMGGKPVPSEDIWHFKGPAAGRHAGMITTDNATKAIRLAAIAESFGIDLFTNRAALEGILSVDGNATDAQLKQLRESFTARQTGEGKRGRTAVFPTSVKYQALSMPATDAQWIAARQHQIEEVCRYFRVSPTKVFHTLGSQSYSSVEQAHIAHDQDTDAHWHARFAQSATRALLSPAERRSGYSIVIDNRDYLRGTANERATYYASGISAGWLTKNEAREAEGYARSSDPDADKLTPAVNLFGDQSKKPSA